MNTENRLVCYVIPKNIKKGKLYFGRYKISDLIILGISFLVIFIGTVVSVTIFTGGLMLVFILLFLIVGGSGVVLTTPFFNYHNLMGYLKEIVDFLKSDRKYVYGGRYYEKD